MRFRIMTSFTFLFFLVGNLRPCNAQKDSTSQYLMASFGLNLNSYHSLGARLYFDYSKEFSEKWLWGVSYELSRHINSSFTAPEYAPTLHVSQNILSGNIYRELHLPNSRVHWRIGAGLGLVHAYWDESDRFAPAINISLGMHFQVSRNVWITTSAFPYFLATNRITYAPVRIEGYKDLVSGSVLNIGFQARL